MLFYHVGLGEELNFEVELVGGMVLVGVVG